MCVSIFHTRNYELSQGGVKVRCENGLNFVLKPTKILYFNCLRHYMAMSQRGEVRGDPFSAKERSGCQVRRRKLPIMNSKTKWLN